MFGSKDVFFGSQSTGGYRVAKSLRFRQGGSNNAYLNRTSVASPTNVKKYTVSFWTKLSKLGDTVFMNTGSTGATGSWVYINSSNQISFNDYCSGSRCQKVTTPVYRDPSSWYHIVCTLDTTVPAMKVYVNGVEVTVFGTNTAPTLNANTSLNAASAVVNIGRDTGSASYFDGYLAEFNYIDGQALDPTNFGAFDATTGVWGPKAYSGSGTSGYGANGFYLKFTDITSTTTLCYDYSGVSPANNWTPNNISLTAGVSYDSMVDSPTQYDDTGNGVGNYATLNPLSTTATLSDGNLNVASLNTTMYSTQPVTSGKWYWEFTINGSTSYNYFIGVASPVSSSYVGMGLCNGGNSPNTFTVATSTNGTVTQPTGSRPTMPATIAVKLDIGAGSVEFYINGTLNGSVTGISNWSSDGLFSTYLSNYTGTFGYQPVLVNFGQRPFAQSVPSGHKALNTYNFPTPTISAGANYMAAVTYQGATAPNTVTTTSSNSGNNPNGITFQPDFVWIKSRSAATDNKLTDSVRGVTKALVSNTTAIETTDTNGLTAFTTSGFTVGSDTTYNNTTGPATYIAWEWFASGAPTTDNVAGAGNVPTAGSVKINGSNSTSTLAGSIAATRLSANTTCGFSVVGYTGTGANATVAHGLSAAPKMIIVKRRGGAESWPVYHTSLTSAAYTLTLNNTNAQTSVPTYWNSSAPDSDKFSIGTDSAVNTSAAGNTYIAWCWTDISGYSAFGKYSGNGSADGPFIYCGFRPRWILIKEISGTNAAVNGWQLYDTSRNVYNVSNLLLRPNTSAIESSSAGSTGNDIDILSNGFKLRTSWDGVNESSGSAVYVYAAFAENPFKYSLAR